MNRKIVITSGKNRLAFSGPATDSASDRKNPSTLSISPWSRPGTSRTFRVARNDSSAMTRMAAQVATMVLVT